MGDKYKTLNIRGSLKSRVDYIARLTETDLAECLKPVIEAISEMLLEVEKRKFKSAILRVKSNPLTLTVTVQVCPKSVVSIDMSELRIAKKSDAEIPISELKRFEENE